MGTKGEGHQCAECGKVFRGSGDLRKHERVHSGERPYSCDECGKAFRQAGSLRVHAACSHGTGGSKFSCDFCGKSFPVKERLRLHLRTHTGERPYRCSVCNKSFARGGQLAAHARTHSGQRPHTCDHCPAAFTCAANLRLHAKRHADQRDYVCDVCGKAFVRPDALKKHLQCLHGGVHAFRCGVCGKKLKGHLPQHVRTHRAERPHGCADCGARFAQRSQLTVHQRTHSGERPYRCRVCWKAFAHSTALTLHTRRHTGVRPFACLLCPEGVAFAQLPHLKKHMLCVHKTNKPYLCVRCQRFYKTKIELEAHNCQGGPVEAEEVKAEPVEENGIDPPMPLEQMRLSLAVLLKRISNPKRLDELGFDKRLIDDVLLESIEKSGRSPCKDTDLTTAQRLQRNVQILLDWTVPKQYMDRFKLERRSTEELLKELTS